jgi:molybdopterin-guanine dinucleotide biosynthesis protein A
MPFVSLELLKKLAAYPSPAPIVAPRRGRVWEPLFARYDAARVIALARTHSMSGQHGLQTLLDAAGAASMPIDVRELDELRDWDRPEDRLT